jgi:hypothetical protein
VPERFEAPVDLTLVGDADLTALETRAIEAYDAVNGQASHTPDDLVYAGAVANDLDRIRAELRVRSTRAQEQAALAQQEQQRQLAALNERVHGPGDGAPAAAPATVRTDLTAESIAQATAQGVALALFGDDAGKLEKAQRRFASLSVTQRQAPDPQVPARTANAVTASIDIPGVAHGTALPDMAALGEAFQRKAKAIPVTHDNRGAARHLVASVRNEFDHTVDDRTPHGTVEELLRSMVEGVDSAASLVAGGGWCAPSEVRYDFFNIASAAPRMIDLPTLGVSRGGIRFPVSPAIGDVFFQNAGSNPASGFGGFAFSMSNGTDPWLWTESDDALTVTGSVNKPVLRVPCPTFSETRLECYGISLTAGNLTDDAYPEATQNFIRLLRAAYAHAINARLLSLMQTASSSAINIGTAAHGVIPQLPNAVALAATDYRNRYAMDEDAVLEVVFPFWVLEMARSDLGYKPGLNDPSLAAVVDAQIIGLFTSRNVRPQFVSDWQVRGTGLPGVSSENLAAWPTSVDFMLYAAGTFVHGNGLQLDLGVIRDSVLNAENDFTALWAEECHLIAKVGHASRRYTLALRVDGTVGTGVAAAKV